MILRWWFDRTAGPGTRAGMQHSMRFADNRPFRPSRSCAYEGWTVMELKKRARQLGISGYSGLNKERLISLIRDH